MFRYRRNVFGKLILQISYNYPYRNKIKAIAGHYPWETRKAWRDATEADLLKGKEIKLCL